MDSGSGGASAERSKEVFRRLIEEGFNKGNLEALDDCFPLRYVEHQFAMPSTREEFKRTIRSLRETFSPFSLTIEDMVADGDKVWARMTGRGTDSKGYRGRPPTGKSFAITVIDVCRFEDGKITEHWGFRIGSTSWRNSASYRDRASRHPVKTARTRGQGERPLPRRASDNEVLT
jgi:predicted ester cyclase